MRTLKYFALICVVSAMLCAHAIAQTPTPRGWTKTSVAGETHTIIFTSPDGEVQVTVGPSMETSGLKPAEYLARFTRTHFGPTDSLVLSRVKTNAEGKIKMASQSVRREGAAMDTNQVVWALVSAGKPVQFVRVQGRPDSDAERRALAEILTYANQPLPLRSTRPKTQQRAAPVPTQNPAFNDQNIDRVVHSFGKRTYNTVSGLYRYKGEGVWIILKDGWAYKMPQTGLPDLQAPMSERRANPNWTKLSDLPESVRKAEPFPRQRRGKKLTLSVNRPNVSGNMGMSTVTRSGLKLKDNGTFEISSSSLTSAAFGAPPTMGTGFGGGINKYDSRTGRYAIEGYTITLNFDDGETLKTLFATKPSGDTILGNTLHWLPK